MRRGPRIRRAVLAAIVALGTQGCAPADDAPVASPELRELERLAFIPRGPCYLVPFHVPFANCSILEPIVMDLYELTRGELEALFAEHAPGRRPRAEDHRWTTGVALRGESTHDWPAFLTLEEAMEVAAWRGMRLPTAREWIHVAVGRRGSAYPWGRDQSSMANTAGANIGRPTPVGTFENGRSVPFGCYDMVGNVWEWVTDAVPGYLDSTEDLSRMPAALDGDGPGSDASVSVLGGSFATPRRPTFGVLRRQGAPAVLAFQARRKHPATLSPEIGVRLCADAEAYLWTKSARWGDGPAVRERVRRVGRRWAVAPNAQRGLLDVLEELVSRPGAARGLTWLLEGARGDAPATGGAEAAADPGDPRALGPVGPTRDGP